MPLFASLLSSLFTSLGTLLGFLFAGKVAVRVGAVASLVTLGAALMLAFNAFVSPLAAAVFSTQYGQLLGLIFPPVSGSIMSGLLLLWAACAAYRLKVRAIGIASSV